MNVYILFTHAWHWHNIYSMMQTTPRILLHFQHAWWWRYIGFYLCIVGKLSYWSTYTNMQCETKNECIHATLSVAHFNSLAVKNYVTVLFTLWFILFPCVKRTTNNTFACWIINFHWHKTKMTITTIQYSNVHAPALWLAGALGSSTQWDVIADPILGIKNRDCYSRKLKICQPIRSHPAAL